MWANDFAFSPDGKWVAGSATNPADICICDMQGNLLWQNYGELLGELLFSEDSKTLYVVNGMGITALDAGTGEEKSKTRISFPYQLHVEDMAINAKKDRLVYALNKMNIRGGYFNEEDGVAAYIYVYELSTGNLVQAERIEEDGKKIEDITLSPDGEFISIRIDDGSYVNECHQVICKIDLDKKARNLPKIKRDEIEENTLNFLLDNSFDLGYWSLNLFYDGTYTISGRHDGTMTGRYELYKADNDCWYVDFSGCGYNDDEDSFELTHKARSGETYVIYFPGTFRVEPDYIDIDVCGAFTFTDDSEVAIPSSKKSPSGKEYDYLFYTTGAFEKVKKYPSWGEKNQSYLVVRENTKMREEPFLSADEVYMSYYDYDKGKYIDSRCILYAGTRHRIIGETVRKDTIDGVTAPWYLIWESDGGDGPDVEFKQVWCFGGYSYVTTESEGSGK